VTRLVARLGTLVVALVALFAVAAAPVTAKASESDLRDRAHARISAIMSDAVSSGIYSPSQANYVTSALLPPSSDPKQLSARAEQRTIDAFWSRIADVPGVSVAAAQSRLSNGATLLRVTGDSSSDVQRSLYNWLSLPVVQAQLDGNITRSESATLRDDIARAVDRLMRQPGGSDGRVAVSPRRI
jgi:hypothetical protein